MTKKIKVIDADAEFGLDKDIGAVEAAPGVERRIITSCAERVSASSVSARIRALESAATETGVRRSAFLAAVRKLPADEPAITVTYGKTSVSINKDGEPLFAPGDKGGLALFPAGVHPLAKSDLPGSAPGNKMVDKILVPSGACAVVAGGGKGKTPLAHALASAGVSAYSVVRVGEPLAGYASSHESIAFSIAIAILDSSDVVLDSIKDLLAGGGAAMKSGLSREALTSLSSWASTACDAGCTLYIPVNPSTPDPEVTALLVEAGKSNATMLVTPTDGHAWEYFNRKGEGLPRTSGRFNLFFSKDGAAEIKNGTHNSEKMVTEAEITRVVATALSRETVSNAVRRALTFSSTQG